MLLSATVWSKAVAVGIIKMNSSNEIRQGARFPSERIHRICEMRNVWLSDIKYNFISLFPLSKVLLKKTHAWLCHCTFLHDKVFKRENFMEIVSGKYFKVSFKKPPVSPTYFDYVRYLDWFHTLLISRLFEKLCVMCLLS